jgi:subtilisin family serine protease
MKKIIGLIAILSTSAALATTVAIIDSGVDVKHEGLTENIWTNPTEIPDNNRDEDKNGYPDDIYGWNFAGQNNQVINYNYLGTFGTDVYKFFAIQAKQFRGTITRGDKEWVKEKRTDQEFMASLGKFGNFVHGTHVAGIAAEGAADNKILAVKLIPTEAKEQLVYLASTYGTEGNGEFKEKIIKAALTALATAQADMLADIGYYIASLNADVANGSFGTGYPQSKMIIGMLYKTIFRKDPSEEDLKKYSIHFINSLIESGRAFTDAAPKTLYVFAAGNDGLNNDEFGTSPANIKSHNVITVAATFGRSRIAVFSNYGREMVDIAAPGVIINSEVPGNQYLMVSGTSQASPYIANVAGRIKTNNPSLVPAQIKAILMGTVDKKDFLSDKVKSGGIVNDLRAVVAAKYSMTTTLNEAIAQAMLDIKDMPVSDAAESATEYVVPVMALPSLIK